MKFQATHGHSRGGIRSPTYRSWQGMRSRCYNSNDPYFHRYGARGIRVCKRWLDSFENFLADMGERPQGLTLERKKNDFDYSFSNCKWGTRTEQSQNREMTVWIDLDGKRQCLSAWSREYGLSPQVISQRLKRGWGMEQAIKTPTRGTR